MTNLRETKPSKTSCEDVSYHHLPSFKISSTYNIGKYAKFPENLEKRGFGKMSFLSVYCNSFWIVLEHPKIIHCPAPLKNRVTHALEPWWKVIIRNPAPKRHEVFRALLLFFRALAFFLSSPFSDTRCPASGTTRLHPQGMVVPLRIGLK